MRWQFLIAFLAIFHVVALVADPNVINTKYGPIKGSQDILTGVRVWHGVPYATPPTGDNRLRVPKPPQPWTKTLDCIVERDICPQFKFFKGFHLGKEDCLYLSVYKPDKPKRKGPLPVFFWIYGGGWVVGDGYEFGLYDAKNFSFAHDVIVVAPNYRLGSLGFMALDELKEESGMMATTGNYALLDQRLALEWVQDNIAAFGGDPKQVVIAGESAGAFSVCFHVASQGSRGLFQGAIMQSGSCDTPYFWLPYNASVSWSNLYTKLVGCDSTKYGTGAGFTSCLRKLSTDAIVGIDQAKKMASFEHVDGLRVELEKYVDALKAAAPQDIDPEAERVLGLSSNPRLAAAVAALTTLKETLKQAEAENRRDIAGDEYVPVLFPLMSWGASLDSSPTTLDSTPFAIMSQGRHNHVPIILGSNQDEGTIFLFTIPFLTGVNLPLDEKGLRKTVEHLFKYYQNSTMVDSILQQYPSKDFKSQDDRAAKILRDFFFACPTRRTARALATTSPAPVYLYQYNYRSFIDGVFLGAYHASELPLVFANEWPIVVHAFSDTDRKVSNAFGAYWSNFVASRNPNNGTKVPLTWPTYDPASDLNLDINKDVTQNSHLFQAKCDFWDQLIYPSGWNHTTFNWAHNQLQEVANVRAPESAVTQARALDHLLHGEELSTEELRAFIPVAAGIA